MSLKIGVHPSNLHLTLAQHWPGAFPDVDVTFVTYPEGRDTGRQLAEGRIAGYRNFITKIWNAARFCQMNECVIVPGFDPVI